MKIYNKKLIRLLKDKAKASEIHADIKVNLVSGKLYVGEITFDHRFFTYSLEHWKLFLKGPNEDKEIYKFNFIERSMLAFSCFGMNIAYQLSYHADKQEREKKLAVEKLLEN